jgi:antitoxin FitA
LTENQCLAAEADRASASRSFDSSRVSQAICGELRRTFRGDIKNDIIPLRDELRPNRMAQVLIRNVPDDVIAAHRKRAKAHGRSLEQELRNLIERAAPYSPEERLAAALRFQSQTPAGPRTDPAEFVREDRDR